MERRRPWPRRCPRSRRRRTARRTRPSCRRRCSPRCRSTALGLTRRAGLDDRAIGLLDALPAVVAVHRPVATAHRADDALAGELLLERAQVAGRRAGLHVAAVEERVDDHRDAALARGVDEREEVRDAGCARRRRRRGRRGAGARPPPRAFSMTCGDDGLSPIEPSATVASMRMMSISAMRPAPKLRWPTSLLPICPGGSPTSGPLVPMSAAAGSSRGARRGWASSRDARRSRPSRRARRGRRGS